MAICEKCKQRFNGTPWNYDGDGRIHVDCGAVPPPKPKLGVGDVGASPLPTPARAAGAKSRKRNHRRRQSTGKSVQPQKKQNRRVVRRRAPGSVQPQQKQNRTVGKCTVCGRNVQSLDRYHRLSDGFMHANCDAAAKRMDRK